ncbi:MAG: type VI secretion system tube protein Hcp [Planctomycetes bacterium]|nr:type VI secretion system tube protein Hcp [Planctomycetota bacterium]
MFSQLFSNRKSRVRRQIRRRLTFQQLEPRRLMAVAIDWPALPQPDPAGGDWIDLFPVEIESPHMTKNAGTGTGKSSQTADFNDIAITQIMDAARPKTQLPSGSGFGEDGITINPQSPKPAEPYLKIDINDPRFSTPNDQDPTEKIDLKFKKIEFKYQPSDDKGQRESNLESNHPIADLFDPVPGGREAPESQFERAIQETSEELSRLQNQQPVPSLEDLPYISRLFRNGVSRNASENDSLFMMVIPRIIIQQESTDLSATRRANDKLVDAPTGDGKVEVDPFSQLQELREAAEKKLVELKEEVESINDSFETIGDLNANGEGDSLTRRLNRIEFLKGQIAVVEADLEFLNDPKVSLWARNYCSTK